MSQDVRMTDHALCRMQQRGLTKATLSFVLANADRYQFVGKGCQELWISQKNLKRLKNGGESSRVIERSSGIAVIISSDGVVVTVFHKTERARNKNKMRTGITR
jgi:hypothetical protein